MTHSSLVRRAPVAVVATICLLAGTLLTGCSDAGSSETSAGSASADRAAIGADAPAPADTKVDAIASNARGGGSQVQHRAEISHGNVILRAPDVADARTDVRRLVDRYDGEVAADQTDTDDDGRVVSANLVVRVPSSDFVDAMDALRGVAELAYASSDTKDVTTRVIDTRVRLRAQRRSVHRVETLLGRAQDLRDIVLIENELAQRQAALDSLEQQSAYLADQTSLATIAVEIDRAHHAAAKKHEDHTGFLAGLSAGWHGLTAVAVGLATALGAVLPFAVALLVLAALAWPALRVARRRHRPPTPSTPAG
ncbi:hypothetical protein GCM10009844_15330 [Nocardioides koreensis]|uniref:DUF4349 domain-containing protein n=1 Tax=Nocardioides koreensis TaxID=433651 RepID=A0ABN2ZJH7_9ACTN